VPRSDIPPPAAATQSQAAASESAQQPQATEAGNAEAASTAETSNSTSSPEPARIEDSQAQAQAQASRATRSAQRAEQATAASDPVLAQADDRAGGVADGQQGDGGQVQAQDAAQPTEVVAEGATNSRPPSLRPPLILDSQDSDDRGQGVAAQNAQESPIQAFTANENESTSIPPTQTPSPNSPSAPAAESSQTDNNLVPATAVVAGSSQPAAAAPTPAANPAIASDPEIPQGDAVADDSANVAGNLVTTIGLNNAGTAGADNAATTVPNAGVDNGGQSGGIAGAPTAVVAGSVIGGLAVVSLVAFILWFWRKRVLRRRRSTLLTPLSVGPSFGRGPNNGEKSYFIDRASVGPTAKSSKLKAAVGANFKKVFSKSREDSVSVNMNRGNSQFMDPSPGQHSRASSRSSAAKDKGAVTGKDRFMDWWSRLTADVNFNWKIRNDRNAEPDPFTAARDMKEKTNAMGNQPDFLTLLSMDDGEVQLEAQRRQQMHAAKGSASSTDHFLGGLNLNFDSTNPFSDSNALSHDSAKPAPLVVSQPNNPFSDDNAIKGASKPPTSYVAEVRRSRGQSLGGGAQNGRISNAPFSPRVDSMYRESMASVDPFGSRRNKFRSDPFDLDRPEVLGRQNVPSSNFSTAGSSTAPRLSSNGDRMSGLPGRPGRAHQRSESFSSKYSSGISLGDWSDPGPDVGPAGRRWDSPTEGWRPGERSRRSGSSQRSVGKAL